MNLKKKQKTPTNDEKAAVNLKPFDSTKPNVETVSEKPDLNSAEFNKPIQKTPKMKDQKKDDEKQKPDKSQSLSGKIISVVYLVCILLQHSINNHFFFLIADKPLDSISNPPKTSTDYDDDDRTKDGPDQLDDFNSKKKIGKMVISKGFFTFKHQKRQYLILN